MNKFTFTGDGKTKDFYFTFPFFTKSDIVVKKNDTDATGYGVFCAKGSGNNDFPFIGGHIHFARAPKSTDIITIERQLQLNRLIDYQPTIALNPTTLNQDMNYFFELLKDLKNTLTGLQQTYSDFTDTETAQTLLTRINAVMDEIDTVSEQIADLGDISTIQTSISNLNTSLTSLTNSVNSLTATVGTHTTNIGTLDTRTTGMLDYVIESQAPTAANNYTWYRKYKSGWIEQGGIQSGSISIAPGAEGNLGSIVLPVKMKNTSYCAFATGNGFTTLMNINKTQTTCVFIFGAYASSSRDLTTVLWKICGISD